MKIVKLLSTIVLLVAACKVPYQPVSRDTKNWRIENSLSDSLSILEDVLQPYRDSMQTLVSRRLCYLETAYKKSADSSGLGVLLCEALRQQAGAFWEGKPCEVVIYNPGGLRIPQLGPGWIDVGKVYELLPFENYLTALDISGDILKQWLQLSLAKGGWPRAGVRYEVADSMIHAAEVWQAGTWLPIQEGNTYRVLTNDYVANGGDNCSFLRTAPRVPGQASTWLVRDAMIQFFQKQDTLRKPWK